MSSLSYDGALQLTSCCLNLCTIWTAFYEMMGGVKGSLGGEEEFEFYLEDSHISVVAAMKNKQPQKTKVES